MKNPEAKGALPKYGKPPVVETIVGIQFDVLPEFRNGHLGAFWKSLSTVDWPNVGDAPTSQPQFERFGTISADGANPCAGMPPAGSACTHIKNKEADRLIQIQNGMLKFHWLGQTGGAYPRYETVRDWFVWAYMQFDAFVRSETLGDLRPNQWEVTYLNHIPKGTVWNTPTDWKFFQPMASMPSVAAVIDGESFGGTWHFAIPVEKGRLHVDWRHTRAAGSPPNDLVALTLTARGPLDPEKPDLTTILDGLNLGHETIVRSFERLMTPEANKFWELDVGKE